ncbi:putative AbiEii toxin of type IV toxin-antitoxin system [Spirosoma oryzae]|uniref:Putative AbiEii toxin of type IV toxin-antitoxin system n=2 Tax=Spirosoma oryzae TaxID=1469603 RepID=A0A2T0SQ16_9BACT|nr:putative AbiEii toxin of type IV toxin-antitoxin system [Spirosoma oryzae]
MNYQAISSLFSDWKAGFLPEDGIRIQQTLTESYRDADVVLMRLVNYLDEIDEQGDRISRKLISDFDANAKLGLEVALPDVSRIVSLDRRLGRSFSILNLNPNIQFVRTNEISRDVNGLLWDKITLTHKQDLTIDALKIIEPDLDLINFVSGSKREERRALVKLRRHNFPIFLSSMGDGINRILTIILAMVNCENGYFLLDEFENGLHYSVQEQLWKVVFTVAERLNIQVFVTTHSYDCINAFANVLANEQYKKDFGYMIRLDNYDGDIEATLYDSEEVQTTTRVHVDPR